MLVDSSVWVSFLRGDATVEVAYLRGALSRGHPIWLAPPILQEVLQGADSPERFAKWDRVLGELPLLPEADPRSLARAAAHLYANCRWGEVTPRSATDCLIAAFAIRARVPLLHQDRDFVAIAKIEPALKLLTPK
jgi:predicted nucleic acid-binding protein